jgi:hypothetical protein
MPNASSPWWTTLLIAVATAAVPSLAGYLAVEKHAQRMKEKEQLLTREQFEAEQVAKYLTLPHKDVLTKRAMGTYLQAVYHRANERTLHRWVTKQIDFIDEDKKLRRARLEEAKRELDETKKRRDDLTLRRTELEAELAKAQDGRKKAVERELKELEARLAAATAEVERRRAEFEEETRQTLDLNGTPAPGLAPQGYCTVAVKGTDGVTQTLPAVQSTPEACSRFCAAPGSKCTATFRSELSVAQGIPTQPSLER